MRRCYKNIKSQLLHSLINHYIHWSLITFINTQTNLKEKQTTLKITGENINCQITEWNMSFLSYMIDISQKAFSKPFLLVLLLLLWAMAIISIACQGQINNSFGNVNALVCLCKCNGSATKFCMRLFYGTICLLHFWERSKKIIVFICYYSN